MGILAKVGVVSCLLFASNQVYAVITSKDIANILSLTDYYEILGVARDASVDDIKKAYKKLALQYHPDKAPADLRATATEAFTKIGEAHATLSDADKRRAYDAGIPGEAKLPAEEPLTPGQQKIWDEFRLKLNEFLKSYSQKSGTADITDLFQLRPLVEYGEKGLPEYSSTLLTVISVLFISDTGLIALIGPAMVTAAQQMKTLFDSYFAPYLQNKAQQLFDEANKKVTADEKINLYKKAFDEIFYVAFFKEDVRSLYITKYLELIDSLIKLGKLAKARQELENLEGIIRDYWSVRFSAAQKDLDAVIALKNRLPVTVDQLRQNLLELEIGLASLTQALK